MTFHRLPDIGAQFVQRVGFGNDVGTDAARDIAALGGFFNDEKDFGVSIHGSAPLSQYTLSLLESNEIMRLLIQQYLANHSLAELESAFAISARRHGKFPRLVMLKYNQIESPMNEPIVQQCRGIILDEADHWRVISYPFDKFFNYGEPNAAAIDWATTSVYEKLDGSLMTLYWYEGAWRVASSGMPDAAGLAHVSGITFDGLFWKTWELLGYQLPENPSPGVAGAASYLFELMTPFNRVIIPHTSSRLVFLGMRNLDDMQERGLSTVDTNRLGWEVVRTFSLGTLADCVCAAGELRGIDGEGFVVCDAQFRRVKVKCPQYVALSHLKETLSPRAMLNIVRRGESDEFLTYFPELRPVYDSVQKRFEELVAALEAEYAAAKQIESQKDFAAAIRTSRCPAALFAVRNGKAASIREHFAKATQPAVERAVGIDESPTENA